MEGGERRQNSYWDWEPGNAQRGTEGQLADMEREIIYTE